MMTNNIIDACQHMSYISQEALCFNYCYTLEGYDAHCLALSSKGAYTISLWSNNNLLSKTKFFDHFCFYEVMEESIVGNLHLKSFVRKRSHGLSMTCKLQPLCLPRNPSRKLLAMWVNNKVWYSFWASLETFTKAWAWRKWQTF